MVHAEAVELLELLDVAGYHVTVETNSIVYRETPIDLVAPFVEWSKADIAERGLDLGVPYELT